MNKDVIMKSKIVCALSALLFPFAVNASVPYIGLYQTIDDETNSPKSIVALYEYADGDDVELAGRIVALYGPDGAISETLENPTRVADKVSGAPKMVGMDVLWNMEWDNEDKKYEDGKIMDPKSGKVYSSVIWQDVPGALNVRGKIGPFGRTQKWNLLDGESVPSVLQNLNTSDWRPVIIK